MSYKEMPILELRIKHIEQEIIHSFMTHADELKPYIERAVKAYLSSDNIESEINETIRRCLKESILSALNGEFMRNQLEKIFADKLLSNFEEELEENNEH